MGVLFLVKDKELYSVTSNSRFFTSAIIDDELIFSHAGDYYLTIGNINEKFPQLFEKDGRYPIINDPSITDNRVACSYGLKFKKSIFGDLEKLNEKIQDKNSILVVEFEFKDSKVDGLPNSHSIYADALVLHDNLRDVFEVREYTDDNLFTTNDSWLERVYSYFDIETLMRLVGVYLDYNESSPKEKLDNFTKLLDHVESELNELIENAKHIKYTTHNLDKELNDSKLPDNIIEKYRKEITTMMRNSTSSFDFFLTEKKGSQTLSGVTDEFLDMLSKIKPETQKEVIDFLKSYRDRVDWKDYETLCRNFRFIGGVLPSVIIAKELLKAFKNAKTYDELVEHRSDFNRRMPSSTITSTLFDLYGGANFSENSDVSYWYKNSEEVLKAVGQIIDMTIGRIDTKDVHNPPTDLSFTELLNIGMSNYNISKRIYETYDNSLSRYSSEMFNTMNFEAFIGRYPYLESYIDFTLADLLKVVQSISNKAVASLIKSNNDKYMTDIVNLESYLTRALSIMISEYGSDKKITVALLDMPVGPADMFDPFSPVTFGHEVIRLYWIASIIIGY